MYRLLYPKKYEKVKQKTMIKIKEISKKFQEKQVLFQISGSFERGKTNLIIGASGTGKSVLLKCMVGLVKPDEGNIFFDGVSLYESDKFSQTEIRRKIGMLFQGGALFDSLNVQENIMFPIHMLTKMPPQEKIQRVNFCLEKVGLVGINKKMPSELSGGMKKRVGIARAIVNYPEYLFCDEPNSGLDPQTSIKIDTLIYDITKELNTTTIIVTHDMNSVMEIGENIMFIYQGKKLWEGNNTNIIYSECMELHDFIFANKFMRFFKDNKK